MGLKQNVIAALVSPPVRWVNFRFLNRMIAPMGFYELARLIHTGAVKVKVDGTLTDRAEYDPSTNTINASDHEFGKSYVDEKSVLIHEGAHAMLDRWFAGHDINGSPSTMRIVDDETMGFLAGAIYSIAAKHFFLDPADIGTPDYEALKVAKPKVKTAMERGWDGCFTIDFTGQEVLALQTAIKKHPFYKANWHQQAQHDG